MRIPLGGFQRWLVAALGAVWVVYLYYQIALRPSDEVSDPMLVSGGFLSLFAFALSQDPRKGLEAAVRQLRDEAVLLASPAEVQALRARLDRDARRQRILHATVVAVAEIALTVTAFVLVPWFVRGIDPFSPDGTLETLGIADTGQFLELLVVVGVAGALAGYRLGQMAAYGHIGNALEALGITLQLQPGHPDGLGGAGPLHRFLVRQAALVLLPAAWIAVWLLLTATPHWLDQYGHWRFPLMALFVLATWYAWQGFLSPARTINTRMKALIAHTVRIGELPLAERIRGNWWLAPGRVLIFVGLLGVVILAGVPVMILTGAASWPDVLPIFLFGPVR